MPDKDRQEALELSVMCVDMLIQMLWFSHSGESDVDFASGNLGQKSDMGVLFLFKSPLRVFAFVCVCLYST